MTKPEVGEVWEWTNHPAVHDRLRGQKRTVTGGTDDGRAWHTKEGGEFTFNLSCIEMGFIRRVSAAPATACPCGHPERNGAHNLVTVGGARYCVASEAAGTLRVPDQPAPKPPEAFDPTDPRNWPKPTKAKCSTCGTAGVYPVRIGPACLGLSMPSPCCDYCWGRHEQDIAQRTAASAPQRRADALASLAADNWFAGRVPSKGWDR